MGEWMLDPRFLDISISCRLVVSSTPRSLYSREKSPQYPLDRRSGGPQNRFGRRGEEKILDPTGTRTSTFSVAQLVASRYTDYAIPASSELGAVDRFCRIKWGKYFGLVLQRISRNAGGIPITVLDMTPSH
jgi:hypothetical protein